MMTRLVSPSPGASVTILARGDAPSLPNAIMCSHRNAAPADVPARGAPLAFPELVAARQEDAVGLVQELEQRRKLGVRAVVDGEGPGLGDAQALEQRLV